MFEECTETNEETNSYQQPDHETTLVCCEEDEEEVTHPQRPLGRELTDDEVRRVAKNVVLFIVVYGGAMAYLSHLALSGNLVALAHKLGSALVVTMVFHVLKVSEILEA